VSAAPLTGRVHSLQVGGGSTLPYRGKQVRSGFVKTTVPGPVAFGADGLEGDVVVDLRVHGGPDKAICCFPREHLAHFGAAIDRPPLAPGAFGENLTVEDLLEPDVCIGDVFRLGGGLVQVSQPRGPCFKIGARWGAHALPGQVARERRSGFYFRVLEPGAVRPGDAIVLEERRSAVTVDEVMRVTYPERHDVAGRERVLAVPELAAQWRAGLAKRRAA
jgi:MOSC domain-containing protein YiiM